MVMQHCSCLAGKMLNGHWAHLLHGLQKALVEGQLADQWQCVLLQICRVPRSLRLQQAAIKQLRHTDAQSLTTSDGSGGGQQSN
jgi:hypothetical protein